jgi:hypothetical protein
VDQFVDNVTTSYDDVTFFGFSLTADFEEGVELFQITLDLTSGVGITQIDVSPVGLWLDTNSNGFRDGGDVQLGTLRPISASPPANVTFSGFASFIPSGGTGLFLFEMGVLNVSPGDVLSLDVNPSEIFGVGINSQTSATITGDAPSWTHVNAASPAPIPEPSTVALFGAGLAGVGALLLRRARAGGSASDPHIHIRP